MAKRESRQKPRQSVAIRGGKKPAKGDRDTDRDIVTTLAREWTNDRDKLRRVGEWAEAAVDGPNKTDWQNGFWVAARKVLAILNGTERKGKP